MAHFLNGRAGIVSYKPMMFLYIKVSLLPPREEEE